VRRLPPNGGLSVGSLSPDTECDQVVAYLLESIKRGRVFDQDAIADRFVGRPIGEKIKQDRIIGLGAGLLADWAPDEAIRNRILVDNPAALYGFE